MGSSQRQQQQATDGADEETGERADDRYLELYTRTLWLLLDIRDAAKDEQGDVFHGQTTPTRNERVGQFMEEHRDEEKQGRDEAYYPIGGT